MQEVQSDLKTSRKKIQTIWKVLLEISQNTDSLFLLIQGFKRLSLNQQIQKVLTLNESLWKLIDGFLNQNTPLDILYVYLDKKETLQLNLFSFYMNSMSSQSHSLNEFLIVSQQKEMDGRFLKKRSLKEGIWDMFVFVQ